MLAKYIRLSDQDDDCRPGEKLESNSVANQRELLDYYIKYHLDLDSRNALEFIDDGHTGTNFNRPGVQALFSAVKRGEIDCIIVKDFSRFGRNSIEAGEYLERVFPMLNVRFISVNDSYDSKTKQYGAAGDLDVGVRNLINELYSRNVSLNTKTAKRQSAARGECIAAYPFYGYAKGTVNRRQLEIDPPAAEVVRMIFDLWLAGNSTEDIAATLNERQIPSPSMYKRQLGVKRTSWSKRRDEIPWRRSSVRDILQNEQYTGKLISLRTMRTEVGNPKQKKIPKEDWIVTENAFEPIIPADTFQKAQSLLRTRASRTQPPAFTCTLFSRKAFCGVCGLALSHHQTAHPYYKCDAPRGPHQNRCKAVRIPDGVLETAVLAELRSYSASYGCTIERIAKDMDPAELQSKIMSLEQQIEKQWTAKKDAFVKWNSGLISQVRYRYICDDRQREIQRLNQEMERLGSIAAGVPPTEKAHSHLALKIAGATKLTREMVNELIQAVRVFEDGRVEVEWKV